MCAAAGCDDAAPLDFTGQALRERGVHDRSSADQRQRYRPLALVACGGGDSMDRVHASSCERGKIAKCVSSFPPSLRPTHPLTEIVAFLQLHLFAEQGCRLQALSPGGVCLLEPGGPRLPRHVTEVQGGNCCRPVRQRANLSESDNPPARSSKRPALELSPFGLPSSSSSSSMCVREPKLGSKCGPTCQRKKKIALNRRRGASGSEKEPPIKSQLPTSSLLSSLQAAAKPLQGCRNKGALVVVFPHRRPRTARRALSLLRCIASSSSQAALPV